MTYIKLKNGFILQVETGLNIPQDVANQDYTNYLAWVAEGNVAADEPATATVNVSRITRAQGKKQLAIAGLYAAAKALADDPDASDMARIGFYDDEYWLIDSPFVIGFAAALGLTAEQVQDMFNAAALL